MTYATANVPLTFKVNETVSWMGYCLDDQLNVTITGNTTLPGLSDGSHNVVVFANDTFGNMASSNIVYFSVDTTLPNIVILSPLNQTYQTDSVELMFTINKPASWIGYSLDGQATVTIVGNTTLSALSDGAHNVVVYANATTGVGSSIPVYFSVDKTPPNVTSISQYPPKDNVLPDYRVNVNATVVDNFSGINGVTLSYTPNNGTWFSVQMSHLEGDVWNATIPGFPYLTTVNYTITARDNAGNIITSEELGYILQYNVISEFPLYVALLAQVAAALVILALRRSKRIRTN
jgi:hypothetical protein